MPGMPGPVRNREHLYGLPANNAKQQKEADDGSSMACRSAAFVSEVRNSATLRGLKPVASLENPPIPDDPALPSSFYLPEVEKFVSEGE
eukprot:7210318-Heterocapsa_arctica.AAC.1